MVAFYVCNNKKPKLVRKVSCRALAALGQGSNLLMRLRRLKPTPTKAMPKSASVAGSGTGTMRQVPGVSSFLPLIT